MENRAFVIPAVYCICILHTVIWQVFRAEGGWGGEEEKSWEHQWTFFPVTLIAFSAHGILQFFSPEKRRVIKCESLFSVQYEFLLCIYCLQRQPNILSGIFGGMCPIETASATASILRPAWPQFRSPAKDCMRQSLAKENGNVWFPMDLLVLLF